MLKGLVPISSQFLLENENNTYEGVFPALWGFAIKTWLPIVVSVELEKYDNKSWKYKKDF